MSTLDLSEAITKIAELQSPHIPVTVDLWDSKHIGAYLKVSARQVTERYACKPDFPKAIRIPSAGNRGHPRWRAREIIKWAESYMEAA